MSCRVSVTLGYRDLIEIEGARLDVVGNFYADQLRKHAEFVVPDVSKPFGIRCR